MSDSALAYKRTDSKDNTDSDNSSWSSDPRPAQFIMVYFMYSMSTLIWYKKKIIIMLRNVLFLGLKIYGNP